ncbi:MAG: hypothetical protein ACLT98_10845 [Eggerthellaceae bacterium]
MFDASGDMYGDVYDYKVRGINLGWRTAPPSATCSAEPSAGK